MDPTVERQLGRVRKELEALYVARDSTSSNEVRGDLVRRIDELTMEEHVIRSAKEEKRMITYHELIGLWRAAGGRFHGPNVETGTMPEAMLLPFLQALVGPNQTLEQVAERVKALGHKG
jgi:hypothetical protein